LFFAGIAFVVITFAASLTGAGRVCPSGWLSCTSFKPSGRDVPEPGWLSDYQIVTGKNGWPDDGRVVSVDFGWQLHRRSNTQLFVAGTPVLTRAFGIFAGISLAAALLLALLTPLIKMTPRSA
jgi:hypothetical protein